MISIYRLKPQFQALLRPTAHTLHHIGVSANQVTVFTAVGSIVVGLWLAAHSERVHWFLLLPCWCFMRMALNAIDGLIARDFTQSSPLGAYLNELGDIVSDAALYLPFALIAGSSIALVGSVVFLACLAEIAGILGIMVCRERLHDGPMGKSDRAFAFGSLGLVVGLGTPSQHWIAIVLTAIALLLVLTIFNRVRSGIRVARRASRNASLV